MSGPLFPSLVSGARGPSSRHLVEFRAGKMTQKVGGAVHPDKRKGMVYVQHSDDSLIHFCWKDRTTGDVEDDLIIFPDDCEFKRVNKCTTGRVYVLKFKAGPKRLFFWMQEPKTDKDEENCRKVNEYIHNPPGAPGGGSGGGELSALGGEGALQSFLENMRPDQLMQLISSGQGGLSALGALTGPGGLASLLGSGGPASSSSSSSSSRSASESASQSSGVTPWLSTQAPTSSPAAPAASSTTSPTGGGLTPSPPAAFAFGQIPNTPNPPIQLSDLQNILATMNNNGGYAPTAATGSQGSSGVDLTSVCTPEMMAPILCSAEVQQILLPLLPSGESLPQSPEEIADASAPQFQQAMGLFAVALASGQLGPLLGQFGLPPEAVDAANRGDLDAFANAVESSNKGGASKDKNDDDEDNMSLD